MPGAKSDPRTNLTEKRERFCVLYVTDEDNRGNATDCYELAFKPKRATRKTINELASRLLADLKIQARIQELREAVAEKAIITSAEVIQIAAHMARVKISDYYNEDGTLKLPHEWTEEMKHSASSLKVFEKYDGTGESTELSGCLKELKLWDKNVAVDRLFKHFGLYKKDNEQQQPPEADLTVDDMARAVALMLAEAARKGKKKQPA